jgi:predicted transcriptional regulator
MDSSYIIATPHAIFHDKDISGNAKWILTEILNLLKVERCYCWASNDHFAEVFGLKRTTVSYHIHELEKQGWIRAEIVKECQLPDCHLKGKGFHRHIYPLTPLSNILDSLSKILDTPIQNIGYPIQSVASISNTIEKDNKKKTLSKDKEQGLVTPVKSYGNPQVNELLQLLQDRLSLNTLDGSIQDNRNFAWQMVKKYGMEVSCKAIEAAARDQWWRGRITSMRKLYYNAVNIMSNAVGRSYGANQVAIDPNQL